MSPGFFPALKAFAIGTTPPLKREDEASDAFQTRWIEWATLEFKSMRGLVWIVIGLLANGQWFHLGMA